MNGEQRTREGTGPRSMIVLVRDESRTQVGYVTPSCKGLKAPQSPPGPQPEGVQEGFFLNVLSLELFLVSLAS